MGQPANSEGLQKLLDTQLNELAITIPEDEDFFRQKIEGLIAKGANINDTNNHAGITPLHSAVFVENLFFIAILLRNRANPNTQHPTTLNTPLHAAILKGSEAMVTSLVKTGRINFLLRNKKGQTALDLACEKDRFDLAQILLEYGAPHTSYSKQFFTSCTII